MTIPDFPRGAPEGYDATGGTNVDPGNAAAETAQLTALMDAAENRRAASDLAGYAGDGSMSTGGIDLTMTGADDVPGA